MLVREAKEFAPVNVEVVYFATPPDVCIERAMGRRRHPTLPPENAAVVISKFAATFRPPEDPREGPYTAIHVVTLDTPAADIRALISRLQSLGPS